MSRGFSEKEWGKRTGGDKENRSGYQLQRSWLTQIIADSESYTSSRPMFHVLPIYAACHTIRS